MTGRVHFQALAKHDGPGILTRREASHARLYTGNGNDFQPRLTNGRGGHCSATTGTPLPD